MSVLKLTHAGLGQPVYIYPAQLFGFYWSETAKHTILFSNGTTTIPVRESCEEIKMQIEKLHTQSSSNSGGVLQSSPIPEAE